MEPMFEGTLAYGFFGTLPGVILADALIKANRSEEALSLLKRLLDGEAGIFTPELWRMRGELLRRQSGTNADEVEGFLARSMRVASEQGAELYRLRAATSLGGFLLERGRPEQAKSLLDNFPIDLPAEWYEREIAAATELKSELR